MFLNGFGRVFASSRALYKCLRAFVAFLIIPKFNIYQVNCQGRLILRSKSFNQGLGWMCLRRRIPASLRLNPGGDNSIMFLSSPRSIPIFYLKKSILVLHWHISPKNWHFHNSHGIL